jgi:hypothetical protein
LQPTGVSTTGSAVVTLTDTHSGQLLPGVWHTLWLTATGSGLTQTVQARLLVGGSRVYLPLLLKP